MSSRQNLDISLKGGPVDQTYFAGSLNIFAMFYIIPFKIETVGQTNSFRLQTNKFRKVICGINHAVAVLLFVICGYLKCFTYGLQPKRFENIIYTLDFAMNGIFTLTVLKVLWKDQILIERFLNTTSYRSTTVPRYKVWMAAGSCLIIFLCDIYLNRTDDISNCSDFMSKFAQKSFIIEACLVILKILFSIIVIFSQLFYYIGEGLCCTLAINMWQICKKLDGKLSLDAPFEQAMEVYNEHRLTVELVNSFSSALFFTNLMSSLVYYTQAPIIYYFGHQSYSYEKAIMMAYIFITLMIWGFAGECHARTRKTIKKWVNRKQQKADESTAAHEQFKLAAISHNLDSDPIALSCCFFNVTYGFEASMLGLLVSYNIIIFQMEEQGSTIKASASVTQ